MYPFDAQPVTRIIIHPSIGSALRMPLALDDYLVLQELLRQEQDRKERVSIERQRLQQAMYNLKELKEQYRRERCRRIQRCLEAFQRQALIRQAQEEAVYRQRIAAAIEQQRADDMWNKYQQHRVQNDTKSISDEQGFRNYRADQLGELLKIAFGQQSERLRGISGKDKGEQEEEEEEEEEKDNKAMQDVWNYVTRQEQQMEDSASPSSTADDARAETQETPRAAFLAPEHEYLEDKRTNKSPNKDLSALHDNVLPLRTLVDELVTVPADVQHKDESLPDNDTAEQEALTPTPMFRPEQIIAEAEPTPTQERDVSIDDMDTSKAEKLAALRDIQQQLDEIQERNEAVILGSSLKFQAPEKPGPLTLPASTKNNRAYLGYEDEIMRVLLKLDAIDSGGDHNVRELRK
ncbi:hypothetical protein DFQ28_000824, partial [Apophysomyces sp. BC1034]